MVKNNLKFIQIGQTKIGYNYPVFIIAEAGVNHNGRLDLALRLVDAAADAGADAIKFQTFRAHEVVTEKGKMAEYQKKNIGKSESQFLMLQRLELPDNFYKPIIARCRKRNILFLSTPLGGFASVNFLHKLGVKAFKFGSGDINNFPVLEFAARLGKPMILGTGMATMPEVKDAVRCIQKAGNNKIIVLHCTTSYPCPPHEVNLAAMQSVVRELGVLVGYSDHTLGTQVPIMAATLGAGVIEKHLTLDKTAPGPDHKASILPGELAAMVKSVKIVKSILGSPLKRANKSEEKMRPEVRKSIVAVGAIKKGDKFTKSNIGLKRPGYGLSPKQWYKILGKKSDRNYKNDDFIV